MINSIREKVSQRTAHIKSMNMIYEDATSLDNMIMFREDVDDELENDESDVITTHDGVENNTTSDIGAVDNSEDTMPLPGDDDNILDEPLDVGADSVGNTNGGVSKEDLLSASIDLKSNTLKDVLPIPPKGAADAVVGGAGSDDILDSEIHVDAGFGSDTLDKPIVGVSEKEPTVHTDDKTVGDDLLDLPLDIEQDGPDTNSDDIDILDSPLDITNDSMGESGYGYDNRSGYVRRNRSYFEDINLDDSESKEDNVEKDESEEDGDKDSDEKKSEKKPDTDPESIDDILDEDITDTDVNTVTDAVLDKVAEADQAPPSNGNTVTKEQLLKKANALTKSISDISNSIINLET